MYQMCRRVARPPQVRSILEILVEVLATPSEPVQRAVSNCLPPLMAGLSADKPYLETLVSRLLKQLSHEQYGHRCGCTWRQLSSHVSRHSQQTAW